MSHSSTKRLLCQSIAVITPFDDNMVPLASSSSKQNVCAARYQMLPHCCIVRFTDLNAVSTLESRRRSLRLSNMLRSINLHNTNRVACSDFGSLIVRTSCLWHEKGPVLNAFGLSLQGPNTYSIYTHFEQRNNEYSSWAFNGFKNSLRCLRAIAR